MGISSSSFLDLLYDRSFIISVKELHFYLKQFLPEYQSKEFITFLLKKDYRDFDKLIDEDIEISGVKRFYLKKVLEHYPVSYITRNRNFYGYDFYVDERVLIPRHETEILVNNALNYITEDCSILDLCTGSGAILITMMLEKSVSYGLGVDISLPALEVARYNADKYGLRDKIDFVCMDISEIESINLKKFDIITCNPPYVSKDEDIELSVHYEPSLALFAEDNGYIFYKKLLRILSKSCRKDTAIFFEIGKGMAPILAEIFKGKDITFIKDYAGIERVLMWKNL
ncbi:MAG: peptide chain release factor N(5)-glutamine methyltransferase [Deferribacterales bacterium]